jgi:hypothetical protein
MMSVALRPVLKGTRRCTTSPQVTKFPLLPDVAIILLDKLNRVNVTATSGRETHYEACPRKSTVMSVNRLVVTPAFKIASNAPGSKLFHKMITFSRGTNTGNYKLP